MPLSDVCTAVLRIYFLKHCMRSVGVPCDCDATEDVVNTYGRSVQNKTCEFGCKVCLLARLIRQDMEAHLGACVSLNRSRRL